MVLRITPRGRRVLRLGLVISAPTLLTRDLHAEEISFLSSQNHINHVIVSYAHGIVTRSSNYQNYILQTFRLSSHSLLLGIRFSSPKPNPSSNILPLQRHVLSSTRQTETYEAPHYSNSLDTLFAPTQLLIQNPLLKTPHHNSSTYDPAI